jgi:putative NADPH-quinone reductase
LFAFDQVATNFWQLSIAGKWISGFALCVAVAVMEELMPEKILIIDGHPDCDQARLCHALANAYQKGCEGGGHEVRRINVAELKFPLILSSKEFESGQLPADISEAQGAIGWCTHMLIIYPLWLGAMPALLKGFFEQVFRPGFAMEGESEGWPKGKLKGKSARIVVTMGMPGWAYRWIFGAHSLKSLERNVLKFAGIRPIRETLYGLVENASDAKRESWLFEMEQIGRSGS